MAMDALENNHNKPSLIPSFPLFNYKLLGKGNFELNIPESFSLAKISQMVQEKLHQDIDLNGDLDLFSLSNKMRPSGSLQGNTRDEASKVTSKYCGERASGIKQFKLRRTGRWREQGRGESVIKAKVTSKFGFEKISSPKKDQIRLIVNARQEPINIPSLASLLSEDEDSSLSGDDKTPFNGLTRYIDGFGQIDEFDELYETDESVENNLSKKCIRGREKFLDESFEVFDYDASLFSAQNFDTNLNRHGQMSKKWTKKLKSNPPDLTFPVFSIFTNFSQDKNKQSFDFTLEQATTYTSCSQIDAKLEESSCFGI